LPETLRWIERVKPQRAIITNMHVDLDFDTLSNELPAISARLRWARIGNLSFWSYSHAEASLDRLLRACQFDGARAVASVLRFGQTFGGG